MLFNSFEFLAFILPVFALYLALDHRWQNRMLLVAGYVFYGMWDWRFLGLLALSTTMDFAIGRQIGAAVGPRKKLWIVVSVVVNLTLLGFFKYANFFASGLAALLDALGLHVPLPVLEVALPVGISFYTFQALSYTINVYRGVLQPASNFIDFALYVSFFPQLVAGPIEKSHHLLPQMQRPRKVTWSGVWSGCYLILWGLFKKVVVADNLSLLVDELFRGQLQAQGFSFLLGAWVFTWQIYADFSGYSDIAKGLARTMGFELMVNFDTPLFARNLIDHWHRWHISLSTWFRDYLYIPLGGSRVSSLLRARNLMITFVVSGLWHGAATKYVAWGFVHGLAQVGLTLGKGVVDRLLGWLPERPRHLLGVLVTFQVVALAFALWQTDGLGHWLALLGDFARDPLPSGGDWGRLGRFAGWIAVPFGYELLQQRSRDIFMPLHWKPWQRGLLYALLLAGLLRFGVFEGAQFIYFQF